MFWRAEWGCHAMRRGAEWEESQLPLGPPTPGAEFLALQGCQAQGPLCTGFPGALKSLGERPVCEPGVGIGKLGYSPACSGSRGIFPVDLTVPITGQRVWLAWHLCD